MIWIAIIAFIISFFIFAYYYNKSESEKGFDSVEEALIGFFGPLIVLIISGGYIWYSIMNTYIGFALVVCALILFILLGELGKK